MTTLCFLFILLIEASKDFGQNPLGSKYFWKLDGTDKNIWYFGNF